MLMPKRVFICGIVHETNTFAASILGKTQLEDFYQLSGQKIIDVHEHSKTITGGFIQAAKEMNYTIIPGYLATTEPSGTIADSAYEHMKRRVLDSVAAALASEHSIQAVAVDLHGAGVSESFEDIEIDLGLAIRKLIGTKIKLICALDLHGNIHNDMTSIFDFMVGFKTYPHEDQFETGHKAMSILPRLLNDGLEPKIHIEHLPITLPTTSTDEGFAAARMNEYAQNVIDRYRTEAFFAGEEILDLTVFHGFPYSDISHVGVHIIATSSQDLQNARDAAREVSYWIWTHRNDFLTHHLSPVDSVKEVLLILDSDNPHYEDRKIGPVCINETSDNTGCGAPGDGTRLLREMINGGLGSCGSTKRAAVFGYFCDPESVEACVHCGCGNKVIQLPLGGKTGDLHGKTIFVDAYVRKITDGRFTLTKYAPGMKCNVGPTVLITLISSGIDVIISSGRQQTFGPDIFHLHGLSMHNYDVIAVKSSVHFRAGFRDLAHKIITCDSPGLSTCLVETFEFTNVPASIHLWPHDLTTKWKPGQSSSSHNSAEVKKRLKAADAAPATPAAAAAARLKAYLQSYL